MVPNAQRSQNSERGLAPNILVSSTLNKHVISFTFNPLPCSLQVLVQDVKAGELQNSGTD